MLSAMLNVSPMIPKHISYSSLNSSKLIFLKKSMSRGDAVPHAPNQRP